MSMYELDTGTLKLMFVNVVAYRGMHLLEADDCLDVRTRVSSFT